MVGSDLADRGDEGANLGLGASGEGHRRGEYAVELGAAQAQPLVGSETLDEVVGAAAGATLVQRHGHSVFLDGLVRPLITGSNAPKPPRTAKNVWYAPSAAKCASGSSTRRTTEHDTSPSFHWMPASPAAMVRCPSRMTLNPQIRSHERAFILWGMAEEPTCPSTNPSVASS